MHVGAFSISKWGKTVLMQHLLACMLEDPAQLGIEELAERYDHALVVDPPTGNNPEGQYPGRMFSDVAEYMRTPPAARTQISRFERPDVLALFRAAKTLRRCIVLIDELDEIVGNNVHVPKGGELWEFINKGRHWDCVILGSARKFGAIHHELKSNTVRAWFGGMSHADSRKAAAEQLGLTFREYEAIGLERHQFVEYWEGQNHIPLVKYDYDADQIREVLNDVRAPKKQGKR